MRPRLTRIALCLSAALAACISTPPPEPVPFLAVGPVDERPAHYLDWNNVTSVEGLEVIQEMLREAHRAPSHTAGRNMSRPEAEEQVNRLRERYDADEPLNAVSFAGTPSCWSGHSPAGACFVFGMERGR